MLGTFFKGWLDCRCGIVKKREIFVFDLLNLKYRVVVSKGWLDCQWELLRREEVFEGCLVS